MLADACLMHHLSFWIKKNIFFVIYFAFYCKRKVPLDAIQFISCLVWDLKKKKQPPKQRPQFARAKCLIKADFCQKLEDTKPQREATRLTCFSTKCYKIFASYHVDSHKIVLTSFPYRTRNLYLKNRASLPSYHSIILYCNSSAAACRRQTKHRFLSFTNWHFLFLCLEVQNAGISFPWPEPFLHIALGLEENKEV